MKKSQKRSKSEFPIGSWKVELTGANLRIGAVKQDGAELSAAELSTITFPAVVVDPNVFHPIVVMVIAPNAPIADRYPGTIAATPLGTFLSLDVNNRQFSDIARLAADGRLKFLEFTVIRDDNGTLQVSSWGFDIPARYS